MLGQALHGARFPTGIYTLSTMPLSFTPLLRLTRCMRVTNGMPLGWPLPLTGWHCKFRPSTKGLQPLLAAPLTINSAQTQKGHSGDSVTASKHELCHHTDDVTQHKRAIVVTAFISKVEELAAEFCVLELLSIATNGFLLQVSSLLSTAGDEQVGCSSLSISQHPLATAQCTAGDEQVGCSSLSINQHPLATAQCTAGDEQVGCSCLSTILQLPCVIGSHAFAPLVEALTCVAYSIPLGGSLPYPLAL
jgi:hypothetical protein